MLPVLPMENSVSNISGGLTGGHSGCLLCSFSDSIKLLSEKLHSPDKILYVNINVMPAYFFIQLKYYGLETYSI